jgi:hypothetical protein
MELILAGFFLPLEQSCRDLARCYFCRHRNCQLDDPTHYDERKVTS